MNRELIHTEDYKGFKINLYFHPEDHEIDWDFTSPEEKQELLDDISNGTMLYFCAEVTASKDGIELGNDFLGSCCYKTAKSFIDDGYYQDMKELVIIQAKEKLKLLCS